MLETQYASIDMICPKCRSTWEAPFARVVNVGTHPEGRLGALLGTMHKSHCPACKTPRDVEVIWDYYDPERKLVIQVRPEWEFHAGGGEDWYWARYEDLVEKYKDIEVQVDVVFGFAELVEKHLGGDVAVAEAKREWEARRAAERAQSAAETAEAGAEGDGAEEKP
ncbi:MAG TPA: CpXC domain-containing protein [Thermomicrobiaceae bacterium]|nr:CpXC domain-containing protein [Thermomicrobiaceae bacterium]